MASTPNSPVRDCIVGVVSSNADLQRFESEQWYRVPVRAIGKALSNEALAEARSFAAYQTGAITNGMPSAIEVWGEIEAIEMRLRRDLIPDEPNHPAAGEQYRQIRLKSVERLEQPIISNHPRRLTFLRTTTERLIHASDVNDLIIGTPRQEKLWEVLRGIGAERSVYMRANGEMMEVDFAIFHGDKSIGVVCDAEAAYGTKQVGDYSEAWGVLRFSPSALDNDFEKCVSEIMEMLERIRAEA